MSFPFSAKIGVWNSRKAPRIIAIEPWGSEYTIMPDEKLEVIAYGENAVPWFNVVERDEATQVYCEETVDFQIVKKAQLGGEG